MLDHALVTADNLSFMATLAPASVKLVVCSPPYNVGKEYEKKAQSQNTWLRKQRKVIAEAVRVLHPQGSICWQVGNYVGRDEVVPLDILLYPLFAEHGLRLRNRIIWQFGHGLHCSRRLSHRYETILWFTKSADHTFNLDAIRVPSKYPDKRYYKGSRIGELSGNPLGKNPSDVWTIPNVTHNHVEKTAHPCQYPVELIERLVLALTNPGDVVLDPYVGAGASVIAAAMHGRIGYGCDIKRKYVAIAQARLQALRCGELRTRPMSRPIHNPRLKKPSSSSPPRLTLASSIASVS